MTEIRNNAQQQTQEQDSAEQQQREQATVLDMDGDELEQAETEEAEEQAIPKQAEQILRMISEGASLRSACLTAHITSNTFYDWMAAIPAVERRYARACSERATHLAEEAQQIADGCDGESNSQVQKAKLQADTRRWFAAKLDPKRYGDYQRTEMTVTEAGNVAGAAQNLLRMRKKRMDSAGKQQSSRSAKKVSD